MPWNFSQLIQIYLLKTILDNIMLHNQCRKPLGKSGLIAVFFSTGIPVFFSIKRRYRCGFGTMFNFYS